MKPAFDHERLTVYKEAVRFYAWATAILEKVPAKVAAKDQLDRASTSVVLNLAEGNGKRSYPDRCRFFDIARGSALECAASLDVLVARGAIDRAVAEEGKSILIAIVAMTAGLLSHFSGAGRVEEEQAVYGQEEKEND